MQTAHALNQQVNRRGSADHQIKVEVEALFDNLGGYQNGAFGSRAIFFECVNHFLFYFAAPCRRKTGMQEPYFVCINPLGLAQMTGDLNRFVHRVADNGNAAAFLIRRTHCIQQAVHIQRNLSDLDFPRLGRRQRMRPHLAIVFDDRQARVGGVRRILGASLNRAQYLLAPLPRQGCRQQNHGRVQRVKPAEQALNDNVHVGVVAVNLIKNDHLAA